jgi:hypothetical protein
MAGGTGTPINRQWILCLKDGSIVIDWGDGLYQDVTSGNFLSLKDSDISHHVRNEELDLLARIGKVSAYTTTTIWFPSLPERPQKTID